MSFFIGRLLPKSWFHGDKFPYRCASWEAKLFRFLRVHEWQDKVPDMSKIVPKLIPAKKLGTDFRAPPAPCPCGPWPVACWGKPQTPVQKGR